MGSIARKCRALIGLAAISASCAGFAHAGEGIVRIEEPHDSVGWPSPGCRG